MITGISPDLPHTHDLPQTREWALRIAKPLVAAIMRTYWRVRVHGADQVPDRGPVILAANHIGLLDGPALVSLTGRLTFAMAKHELFVGFGGLILAHVGQISLNRHQLDTRAIRRAVQVLRAGKALGVFPEGIRTGGEVTFARRGTAYLAMVSGAPVVPVAILGTREPGQGANDFPRRRGPIHVVYGAPITIPASPWPRRKAEVARWTEVVRAHLAAHVRAAERLTGLTLPGPVGMTTPRHDQQLDHPYEDTGRSTAPEEEAS